MTDPVINTEAAMFAEQIGRADLIFTRNVEGFTRQWGPRDPVELAQFSADLMNLMRHMWLDTDAPAKRTLDALMNTIANGHLRSSSHKLFDKQVK